ncbi:hypothetical protein ABK040_008946 [Willaertia magna]
MKFIITIISCSNLIVGDLLTGLADPYVICTIFSKEKEITKRKMIGQFKTEIIYSSLDPIYTNQQLIIDNLKNENEINNYILNIEVYDYDYMKYDDFLGSVEIPLSEFNLKLFEPQLIKKTLQQVEHGDITLDLQITEDSNLFGISLEEIMNRKREQLHKYPLPKLLVDMFKYLHHEEILIEEGIFRIPGNAKMILQLKKCYDNCQDREIPNFILEHEKRLLEQLDNNQNGKKYQHDQQMVRTVASMLKEFIRQLPTPLIDHFDDFVKVVDNQNDTNYILNLIQKLPKLHQQLLFWLLELLFEVAKRSDSNKMTTSNLANVVGINVCWKKEDTANPQPLEKVRTDAVKVMASFDILIQKFNVLRPYFEKHFTSYLKL